MHTAVSLQFEGISGQTLGGQAFLLEDMKLVDGLKPTLISLGISAHSNLENVTKDYLVTQITLEALEINQCDK